MVRTEELAGVPPRFRDGQPAVDVEREQAADVVSLVGEVDDDRDDVARDPAATVSMFRSLLPLRGVGALDGYSYRVRRSA